MVESVDSGESKKRARPEHVSGAIDEEEEKKGPPADEEPK